MSLSLKLGTLAIRTLAKPVGNWIKTQAREHEPFRKRCVAFAQWMHRVDMRMRLGLLQDPAAIDRQVEREAAEAQTKRRSLLPHIPTVPTLEQVQAEEAASAKEKKSIEQKVKSEEKKKEERRIRPLSEAKAIDSGATFISEAFLFLVAAGLIGFETWRNRRKVAAGREAVEERLDRLEGEVKRVEEEKKGLQVVVEGLKGELEKRGNGDGGVGGEVKKAEVVGNHAHQQHQQQQQQQHKPKRKEEHVKKEHPHETTHTKHPPPAHQAKKSSVDDETNHKTHATTASGATKKKKEKDAEHPVDKHDHVPKPEHAKGAT